MPGRPPTPISAHKARGTYRKGRHEGKQCASKAPLGKSPEWFTEVMAAEWKRLALIEYIRAEHRTVVEHACTLYARFVKDAKGEEKMLASERQTFHSIYMQLGLTPASQAKVPAAAPTKAEDPWAELG